MKGQEMKVKQFVDTLKDIAENYETLYVYGCFGAPLTDKNKPRYGENSSYKYNREPARLKKINSASADTFGFDCVCLIKGVLWGWYGKLDSYYGGATYKSNDVPDINANAMLNECSGVSTDFSNIAIGEFLWMKDHCGVYIGDGLAVECTPIWKDGVQITAVENIGNKSGYNTRTWVKHGKLPYVDYTVEAPSATSVPYNIQLTSTLKLGSTGDEVKKLQMRIAQLSPAFEKDIRSHSMNTNGEPDGIFGASMKNAIIAVQSTAGITVTGEVDEDTLKLLNANLLTLNKKIVDAKNALK